MKITSAIVDKTVSDYQDEFGTKHWSLYRAWPNLHLGDLEAILQHQKVLPLFFRYSHFSSQTEVLYFLPMPLHYIRSWRQRFRAVRIALFIRIERISNRLQKMGL